MSLPIRRRDFHALSLAALGGLTAGGLTSRAVGAVQEGVKGDANTSGADAKAPPPLEAEQSPPNAKSDAAAGDAKDKTVKESDAPPDKQPAEKQPADTKTDEPGKKKPKEKEKPKEIHVCRGLNTCKGQGASGENKCAGQGDCATTLRAPHECSTMNYCKGQGGCNNKAGKNACDGQGDGPVPLLEEAWPAVRVAFETKMRLLKKKVGAAPPSRDEEKWKNRYDQETAAALARIKEEEEKAAAEGRPAPKRGPAKPADVADKDKPKDKPPKVDDDGEKALEDLLGDQKDEKGAEKKTPKK